MKRANRDGRKQANTETAYHEAGHVVVALVLKMPFSSVTIERDKESWGHVDSFPRGWGWPLNNADKAALTYLLAGPLCQWMFTGRTRWSDKEVSNALGVCEGRHTKEGRLGIDWATQQKALDLLGQLMDRTERILKLHWHEVKLIAEALLKEKTLCKLEVLTLFLTSQRKSGKERHEEKGSRTMRHAEIVNETLEALTREFVTNPYLCYTEQGLHAMFFCMLFNRIPPEERYAQLEDKKVSVVQKEYPTFHKLKDSRRGHWDIAVLETPLVPLKFPAYDFLKVDSAVEFGLNESMYHLENDVKRLCDKESNVVHRFVAHFYRLSNADSLRDWNPRSKRIVPSEEVAKRVKGTDIVAYYAIADQTRRLKRAFRITDVGVHKLQPGP